MAGDLLPSVSKAAYLRAIRSTGGRARTDTVLSHHRILSPSRFVHTCFQLSGNPLIYAELSYMRLIVVRRCSWRVGVLIGVVWRVPYPILPTVALRSLEAEFGTTMLPLESARQDSNLRPSD
jgi:hypothetical protein